MPESGCLLADDRPEQRRLAGAVGADHADDPGGRQREREILDQQAVAEALAQMVGLDHGAAQARAGRDVDLGLVEVRVALLGEQRLVAVQASLGLGATALGVRPHPLELLLDRALARRLGLLLHLESLLLLRQPGGVVALEGEALAAVELEDPVRDVVEEVAIVGDRHDRALVVGEVLLEPRHGLGVQVVGRLVEQQQVGLGQQQPRQGDAPPLAAAQVGDRRIAGWAAQRVHRLVEHRVELPRAGGVDLVLQLGELVRGLVGVVHRQLVEAVQEVAHRTHAVLDVAANVLALVQVRLLRQQADGGAGRELGLAAVVLVDAGHDPEQRGLAGAVESEHADLGAGEEAEVDVLEDGLVRRVRPAQLVHRVDVGT